MRRGAAFAMAAVLLGLVPSSSTAAVSTEYLRPLALRVAGGTGWRAANDFRLDWELSPTLPGVAPPAAIHYRILDASGDAVSPVATLPWSGNELQGVRVPLGPGAYGAEVWLESSLGQGPRATTALLFDDSRPEPPAVSGPAGWLGAGVTPSLSVTPPSGPMPPSGLRGYAVSVDRSPQGSPCVAPATCELGETDLLTAAGGATSLGLLPEGTHFAHVATVSGAGVRSAVKAIAVRIDATPPQVTLNGVTGGWADGPVRIIASATDFLSGMEAAGPGGPFTALAVDGAPATASPGPAVATTVSGEGVHRLESYARDAAGNAADGKAGAASPAAALVRIDAAPPHVVFLAGQDPAEPERLEAAVGDALAGPSATRGSIAFRRAGTHEPFEPIPTVVAAGRLVAHWDSETQPAGSYEFRATGYDRAGNVAVGNRRADGTEMVLANPLKSVPALRLGFGDRRSASHHRRARSVPYGRRVLVRGRLTSASGSPLAGRQVQLVETYGRGSRPARRSLAVQTGRDGTFATRLAPGPGRRVEARFAGDAVLNHAASQPLLLRVSSAVRLRVSASVAEVGGRPVIFCGRVGHRGASIPAAGLPVELQFRFQGAGWREFRTVQTDRLGRFRYPYAFSDDDSRGVRFQFRASIPTTESWPYEPAASRPVLIAGR